MAPTEDKNDITKKNFYEKLKTTHVGALSRYITIILGVFNAMVGRESVYRHKIELNNVYDFSNDNGKRMIVESADMSKI